MKHLKLFFALFAMLALGVGNAWAEEVAISNNDIPDGYTATTGTSGSFTKSVSSTNDLTISYAGINTKSKASATAHAYGYAMFLKNYGYIYSSSAPAGYYPSKVVVKFGAQTGTSGKAGISFGTDILSTRNSTVTGPVSKSGTCVLENSDKTKLHWNFSTTSANVQVASITVTYTSIGNEETVASVPTFSVPECTFYSSSLDVELSCATDGATIHYTIDGTTPSEKSPTYSGAIAINNTTTIKAIAVKDGLTDSEVVTATYTKGETVTSYDIDFETNALEAYVNWDFSNIAVATTPIDAIVGTYYGNTCGKASASIKTKTAIQYPGTLTFHTSKESGNTTSSSWIVQVSENGSTWTEVASFDATTGSRGTWTERTADLSDYENVYVQISYSGSTAIRAIDEISLAQGVAPVKYTLTIENPENGTLSVTKGGVSVASGDQFKAGTSLVVTPTPASGYLFESLTVDDTEVELSEGKYTFTMPENDVTISATFKANEKPAATLTLSKNGVEETFPGSWKQDDVVTLPSIKSDCVKEFVGWSANASCATEPEYKAGDEYTLAKTAQTLYAVYADGEAGEVVTQTLTITDQTTNSTYGNNSFTDNKGGVWSGQSNIPDATHFGLRQNDDNTHMASPVFPNNIINITAKIRNQSKSERKVYLCSNNTTAKPSSGDLGGVNVNGSVTDIEHAFTLNGTFNQFYIYTNGALQFNEIEVTYSSAPTYSNYSTTCAAAPIATIDPTSVTATVAGGNGKVEVTYENVDTENVSVALFNDAACTEAFTAGWLTASIDADKNITYTVAENTTYAERKAYIQLTAPDAAAATDPAVVVIPVTQAAKDKVFASLEELLANITPTTTATKVTVTLTKEPIADIYVSGTYRNGIYLNVPYQGSTKKIEIYSRNVPAEWVVGGSVSGTLTNCDWKDYNGTWELCPADWSELTYQEPKAVSTVVVSGTPTKTTYVDGEAFDPAGLTVTVNYNDATTEVNPTGVTFAVTPATLVKGQTSVSVTATFNSVTSVAYEVTDLTVNDIPTKTVAEFIAAGGTRCYLEGIVSNITNTTYGNFDLTDASGTIYVYGCLNKAGEKQKFAELGVKNGDKIKVIADQFKVYGGKDQATDVQYVSHVSAASITISDITMEVDEVATITATVDPVDAVVTYTIKENATTAISLSGNTITALAEGTATITATVAEGATYLGNSVDFTVTVGPKTVSDEVVILAELDGKWYAMKGEKASGTGQIAALEVTYFNGTLYNVADDDKAAITWTRTVVDGKVAFVNNGKYLKGTSSDTNLALDGSKCEWTFNGTTYTIGNRTFLYRENFNFKNYNIEKADASDAQGNYSSLPVVTAAKFETAEFYTRSELPVGSYGTICLPYAVNNFTGATFYEVAGKEGSKIVFDEVTELEEGKPYIFMAEAAEIKLAQIGEEYTGSAKLHNSLQGTFAQIDPAENNILVGNYMVVNNVIKMCGKNCGLQENRAYFVATELESLGTAPQPMPGRRRVAMGVTGENEATGVDNITENGVIAPKKLIENGQLIIIRDGVKYNVQGQRL